MPDPILDLLAAPPSPSLSVDEHAVYAGGRRRLRRRTLRRSGLGVVGVVGVAAIAFGTLGPGLGGEALPAGPSPSRVTSTFATSAELFDGTYAVEVIPGAPADQPNVKFYKVDKGKRSLLAASRAGANVVSMGKDTGADGVMLGTAPANLDQNMTIAPGVKGGYTGDEALLPGTGFKAIALRFDDPSDVAAYRDTFWMDDTGSGIVRDAMGNVLPSAKLTGRETFFVARQAKTMGIFTGGGGSTVPLSSGQTTTLGYGEKPESGNWAWRSVTLLPEGSRDVSFEWVNATRGAGAVTLSQVSGGVVAWAQGGAPASDSSPQVGSVTWTDQGGTRHTEKLN